MLIPFFPIARDNSSSGTIANASFSPFSFFKILTITFLAGESAFLTNSAGSSEYLTKSTFSPFNSERIDAILTPLSPIHEPTGSTCGSFE